MPGPTPPLLALKNLTVGYGQPILTDLNLTLGRGQFVALLGANGSGKTTLLRTIAGRLKPLAGTIKINGQNLKDVKATTLAQTLSVVLTDKPLVPLLRVWEFVALGRYPRTDFLGRLTDHDHEIVEESLREVQAETLAARLVDELSDGERQKVVLARALAQEPELTLLDEPTAHLDLKHRLEIMAILRSLGRRRNLTILAAVHDVESATKFADLAVTLKDGRLLAFGAPEAILSAKAVQNLYDCPAASFDPSLGGLETPPDGLAGRAFVLGGQDKAALIYRFLAKKGYALTTGFFLKTDLDAHVARALGAKVFSWPHPDLKNEDELMALSLKELATCDLLAISEANGPLPELRARLLTEAQSLGLPILRPGPNGDLAPFSLTLERLKNAAAA
ncbi:MAG: ABC transporter ATP-binding protein [Deltaproteobacteria bacterium]|jgi:iron complex transport system ATP-binding protein|nr:ABC transporter ATP-binding protein [Deltaproteobacteria bacterium]